MERPRRLGSWPTAFIQKLKPALEAAAGEELGWAEGALACPYIARYLAIYAQRTAAEGEALVRRFTGSRATDADNLMLDLLARTRVGVRYWKQTGKAPPGLPSIDAGGANAADAAGAGAK